MAAGDDPFRKLFLDLVKNACKAEPSTGALHALLKLATPDLKEQDVDQKTTRDKALRALQLRIHPDKHGAAGDLGITRLFQGAQDFVKKCMEGGTPKKKSKTASAASPGATGFPASFSCFEKWPHLEERIPCTVAKPTERGKQAVALAAAAECFNLRGGIVHGRRTGLYFSVSRLASANHKTVEDVFRASGRVQELENVGEIKKELMRGGPVVSLSFVLDPNFLSVTEYRDSFAAAQVEEEHELLIVGWKTSSFGEMWIVQGLGLGRPHVSGATLIPISLYQYSIDSRCVAPLGSLENMFWQPGPYFGITFTDKEWLSLSCPGFHTEQPGAKLEELVQSLGVGIVEAHKSFKEIEIFDVAQKARSRRAYLGDVNYNKTSKCWNITFTFKQ